MRRNTSSDTLVLRHWHHLSTFLLLSNLRFSRSSPSCLDTLWMSTFTNCGAPWKHWSEIFKACCLKNLTFNLVVYHLGPWIHYLQDCLTMRRARELAQSDYAHNYASICVAKLIVCFVILEVRKKFSTLRIIKRCPMWRKRIVLVSKCFATMEEDILLSF